MTWPCRFVSIFKHTAAKYNHKISIKSRKNMENMILILKIIKMLSKLIISKNA